LVFPPKNIAMKITIKKIRRKIDQISTNVGFPIWKSHIIKPISMPKDPPTVINRNTMIGMISQTLMG
jgi:hypothetical protein